MLVNLTQLAPGNIKSPLHLRAYLWLSDGRLKYIRQYLSSTVISNIFLVRFLQLTCPTYYNISAELYNSTMEVKFNL